MNSDQPLRQALRSFTRDGYDFKQVWREGAVAIYQQKRPYADEPAAWEVVILRPGKAHPKDKDQTPKESYPSSNEWGLRGWTYLTFQWAKEKALGLLE